MTDFLPLFPLKMVVFPGERLNLHIFEPRYKQLIRECDQNGITFGIPAFIDEKVMDFGTEIKLLSIERRGEKGEMDVKTQALQVFKIHEFYRVAPNKLYSGADIERLTDDSTGEKEPNDRILEGLAQLFETLNIKKSVPTNTEHFKTFSIAHHVGFSLEQEYEFLCISNERDRQEYMLTHLERLLPIVRDMEMLRKRALMNGHYKNVIPPQIP